jgi:D-xylose transport system ATP-binding protein
MSGSAPGGPAITSGDGSSREPLLRAEGIAKRFGNVRALAGVSLSIYPGEIVALVGDNGAGKSVFVSILSGVRRPDEGHLYIDGEAVTLSTPAVAHRYGIVTVFQDLALVNERDVAANIFLGRELTRFGGLVVDRPQMLRDAKAVIRRLQVGLPDVRTPVKSLSGGQRQAVAVARAIVRGRARMVIMDEPTAALGVRESGKVNDLIRALKGEGRTVLLISHNVEHVFYLADRVAVFRLGHCIADLKISETTHDEVVGLIVRGKQRQVS